MLNNLKPLVVVLVLAWVAFALLRPLCLAFVSEEVFRTRKRVWFVLTIVGFLSPTFWIYAVVAGVMLWRVGKRDPNPLALFAVVTFVIPNSRFYIPTVLIGQLFDLTQYRLLALVILVPAIFRWLPRRAESGGRAFTVLDFSLIAFLMLQVALSSPYQSVTVTMRQAFLAIIDWFVIFYVFSRLDGRRQIEDVMASFCLAALVMAFVAAFEWSKSWLMYTGISDVWGDPNVFSWLMRGDRLRAQASAGGPLPLGFQLAVALGFIAYLVTRVPGKNGNRLAIAAYLVGLYATSSRGPWLTAFIAVAGFFLIRPKGSRQLASALGVGVLLVGVMYLTPLKESILDRLPIIGSSDQDTIEYRQQLADLSWTLIRQNPFFGDPFVMLRMEALRQGQGIIDIVNGYLMTLLFSGWVGMTLQGAGFVGSLWFGTRFFIDARKTDRPDGALGAALISCLIAALFFIAAAGCLPTTYVLAGILVSYSGYARSLSHATVGSAQVKAPLGTSPRFGTS